MTLEPGRELPEGWRWVRLGDIGHVEKGRTPKSSWYADKGVRIIRYRDVSTNGVNWEPGYRSCVEAEQASELRELLPKTTLLTADAHNPELIGQKVTFVDSIPVDRPVFYSGEMIAIRSKESEQVYPVWPCLWLMSRDGYEAVQSLVSGVHLNSGPAKQIPIPCPSVPEQKRIADILTEKLAAVERARKASEARLEAARALPAAYLREVFESEEAKGWEKVQLGELLLTGLRTGLSKPGNPDSDKRCLTLSSLRNGVLLLDKVKPTDISDDEAKRNQLKAGAFYVVRGNGNKSLVGRGGIAPQECDGVTFPDLLFEINPNRKLLSTLFLRWAWDSQSVRSQIEEKSMTAAGIYKINQRNLASIEVPLPSLPVQKQIAANLYKKNSKVKDIEYMADQELAAIDAVPAALLRQAFSGAL